MLREIPHSFGPVRRMLLFTTIPAVLTFFFSFFSLFFFLFCLYRAVSCYPPSPPPSKPKTQTLKFWILTLFFIFANGDDNSSQEFFSFFSSLVCAAVSCYPPPSPRQQNLKKKNLIKLQSLVLHFRPFFLFLQTAATTGDRTCSSLSASRRGPIVDS